MSLLDRLYEELASAEGEIVGWRRHLHRHPEVSFAERRTPAFVADKLREFGIETRTGVGWRRELDLAEDGADGLPGGGVLGYIRGGRPGPTLALRADFDALPIQDEKDAPYRSTADGAMHACGHDGHTAVLLGVARVLQAHSLELAGNVVLLFQHAEEKPPGGARFMIEDGCLDGVDEVYGIHLSSEIPLGLAGLRAGPAMAAVDAFKIKVVGKGGHGARPHDTVDALVIGSQIVGGLQQIVSRRVNPLASAVVSVGVFRAGTAFNVIAGVAEIEGTVRTFDPSLRAKIEADVRAIASGISTAGGARAEIEYANGYPPLVNDPNKTETARRAIAEALGKEAFIALEPVMGAEDFAYYLERRPGAFIHVGARNADERTQFPHHHPRFDIDERALLHAGKLFLALTLAERPAD